MARSVVVGAANWDRVWVLPSLPRPGETVVGDWAGEGPGGKGLNMAVALGRQGAECALVAALGDDLSAIALRAVLAENGVGTSGLVERPGPSGQAAILRVGEECAIAVGRGAGGSLGTADVDAALRRCGQGCELLLLSTEVSDAALIGAVRWVGEVRRGTPAPPGRRALPLVVLGCGPARAVGPEVWAAADVVVCNATEAEVLVGTAIEDPVDAEAAAISLAERQPAPVFGVDRIAVVTLGGAGTVVARPGRATYVPPFFVDVVDPTGAGDCFSATLGLALVQGFDVFAAAARATAAAAVCVGRPGAAAAMPTSDDIDRMIHQVDLRRADPSDR